MTDASAKDDLLIEEMAELIELLTANLGYPVGMGSPIHALTARRLANELLKIVRAAP